MQSEKKQFYSQLEGLRGVAILLVILSHFLIVPVFPDLLFLQLGFWGVNLFFVLSGFLITEILLQDIYRDLTPRQIFKKFYARRTLRIFPIYYLLIIMLCLFNVEDSRDVAVYTLTYTHNIAEFSGIHSELFCHFWSLCVEEQFYLIWPLLLILVNRKHHLLLISIMIFIGISSRVWYIGAGLPNYPDFIWLTPACFDCLGAGALLAWMKLNRESMLMQVLKKQSLPVICTLVALIVAIQAGSPIDTSKSFNIVARLLIALVGFFLVGAGAFNMPTYFSKFSNINFFKSIGRISYGLYVYHMMFYVLFNEWIRTSVKDMIPDGSILAVLKYNTYIPSFIILTSASILLSYLSFVIIEKPILKLKSRF